MKEWLLKDEKNKVGRPKLANEELIKRSYKFLVSSFIFVVILAICLISSIKNISPFEFLVNTFGNKLSGYVSNKNGFKENNYYDHNFDYVMELIPSRVVKNYSGKYKYTLYYLKNNKWILDSSKELSNKTDIIKIKCLSLKNQNRTWKIKLQILNSSDVESSYAPLGWKYVDSKKVEDKYAYKIFTVKGYYSPVLLSEIKELSKSKEKISVETNKEDPRIFNINVPNYKYNIKAYYVDDGSNKTQLSNEKDIEGLFKLKIPNTPAVIKVTINIWVNNISDKELESMVLSNWSIKKDSNNKDYVSNTYLIKPEGSYKE